MTRRLSLLTYRVTIERHGPAEVANPSNVEHDRRSRRRAGASIRGPRSPRRGRCPALATVHPSLAELHHGDPNDEAGTDETTRSAAA